MKAIDELTILWDTVRNETRHKYYKRTVDLAKKYYRFVTGDGLDEDMVQFTRREDATMFQQRKDITKHIIPTVVKNLMDVQYKVPRSNSLTRKIGYAGDKSAKAKKLEGILSKFWGDKSFDDYMGVRTVELNNTDPNTFVVTEFKNFDPTQEHLSPYPFESTSEMSVNYDVDNNILQWLIVLQSIKFTNEKGEQEEGTRHTMYLKERAIKLEEFYNGDILTLMPLEDEWYEINKVKYIRYEEHMYMLVEPKPYDLKSVPAKRIGYKRDLETGGNTFVSPYHDVIPILEKTIKANSELDLTMALHAFPQKIMMGKRCDNPECNQGYITDVSEDGKERLQVCPDCEGIGLIPCTSAQEVLLLEPSDVREEQLSIDDLVRYIAPPVDLITFQDEYVENLTWKAKQAMFNSDIFTKKEVSETATGKNIDMQNVYDTLWPFATRYADLWVFYVTTIADLTDMEKGLEILFVFDKDFKMKTTTELYDDLDKANTSGADAFAIQDIQMDIARNIFANDPVEFNKYTIKQDFYPFSGKSKEEIMALKASNNTTRFLKILEENYSYIFDQIEMDDEKFYLMERKKQWDIIKAKTEELMGEIGEPETVDLSKQFE